MEFRFGQIENYKLVIISQDKCNDSARFLRTPRKFSRCDGSMFTEDALPLKKRIDEAIANDQNDRIAT